MRTEVTAPGGLVTRRKFIARIYCSNQCARGPDKLDGLYIHIHIGHHAVPARFVYGASCGRLRHPPVAPVYAVYANPHLRLRHGELARVRPEHKRRDGRVEQVALLQHTD